MVAFDESMINCLAQKSSDLVKENKRCYQCVSEELFMVHLQNKYTIDVNFQLSKQPVDVKFYLF